MKSHFLKKTKVIATIGPATGDKKILEKLLLAGLNVIRLNMSHGTHDEHLGRIRQTEKASKSTGIPFAVLQDLSGPKIRIGDFYQDKVILKEAQDFILTTEKCLGDEKRAYVNYKRLPKELSKGSIIMLDDGKKKLEVVAIKGKEIHTKVIVGGETKGRRGVNIPGAYLKISSLTKKDKEDLKFGIKNNVDFVALSFVRTAKDISELRDILDQAKSKACIVAKIETHEAVENIDAIIEAADAVMVARGDLAIEIGAEQVPMLQKMIISKCNRVGKPSIVATQMLESMIHLPVPTRAEVSDIANSILDGADAIMLSEETALGEFPIEAVKVMTKVASVIEPSSKIEEELHYEIGQEIGVADSVSSAVVETARVLGAKAIIALTEYGFTARMISRHKPKEPIVVLSPHPHVLRKMLLQFGCYPVKISQFKYVKEVLETVKKVAVEGEWGKKGDKVVIVAGVPFGKTGGTNMMIVQTL